jgi:hypothetical protein
VAILICCRDERAWWKSAGIDPVKVAIHHRATAKRSGN